jgi:hypothetical protein
VDQGYMPKITADGQSVIYSVWASCRFSCRRSIDRLQLFPYCHRAAEPNWNEALFSTLTDMLGRENNACISRDGQRVVYSRFVDGHVFRSAGHLDAILKVVAVAPNARQLQGLIPSQCEETY